MITDQNLPIYRKTKSKIFNNNYDRSQINFNMLFILQTTRIHTKICFWRSDTISKCQKTNKKTGEATVMPI